MISLSAERSIFKVLVPACLLYLSSLCLLIAVRTAAWPLVGDASILHYIVFLLDSGWKPYAQIGDINFPGAYLTDWLVMHLLGRGATAERLYDYTLSALSIWTGWRIAPPRLRPAGIFAGATFFLLHARDGAEQTGQRDWTMALLVLLAMVAWLHASRAGGERWRVIAGCLIGSATLIKPLALLFMFPLVLERVIAAGPRRTNSARMKDALKPCLSLALGIFLPLAGCALWLARKGTLQAFVSPGLANMLFHASLHRLPVGMLVAHGISGLRVPLLLGAALFAGARKRLHSAEFYMLCAATGVGAFCYALQGKGFPYHRYVFAFLALEVVGVIFLAGLSSERRMERWAAAIALCACCLWLGPRAAIRASQLRPGLDQFGAMLRGDLGQLGAAQLDGKVQCLDTFSGCIRVLYELRLRQSTGLLYDEFIFGPSGNDVIEENRTWFARELARKAPEVLVMTPQDYAGASDNYAKVSAWPWFASYLAANYRFCVERSPKIPQLWQGAPRVPLGYRIYLRKDSARGCIVQPL